MSFFISYNHRDSAWAEWIAWQLENDGYRIIIQAWDFQPGSNFINEMDEALKRADRVIAVVSADYLNSSFTSAEWTTKLVENPTGKGGKVIPVRIQDVPCEGLLSSIIYIDLVSKDEAGAKHELLTKIKLVRAKPDREPPFPGPTIKPKPTFPGLVTGSVAPPDPIGPPASYTTLAVAKVKQERTAANPGLWRRIKPFIATCSAALALGLTAGYLLRERVEETNRLRAEPGLLEANSRLSDLRTDYEALQNGQGSSHDVNSRARQLLDQLFSISDVDLSESMQILKYEHICYAWGIVAGSQPEVDGAKRLQAADEMLKACAKALGLVSKEEKTQVWIAIDNTKARMNRLSAVGACVKWQVKGNPSDRDAVLQFLKRLPPDYTLKEHPEETGELQPCLKGSS